jgi:hypothetical protein
MTIGFAFIFTGVFVKYGRPNADALGAPVGVGAVLVLGLAAAAVAPDEVVVGGDDELWLLLPQAVRTSAKAATAEPMRVRCRFLRAIGPSPLVWSFPRIPSAGDPDLATDRSVGSCADTSGRYRRCQPPVEASVASIAEFLLG